MTPNICVRKWAGKGLKFHIAHLYEQRGRGGWKVDITSLCKNGVGMGGVADITGLCEDGKGFEKGRMGKVGGVRDTALQVCQGR